MFWYRVLLPRVPLAALAAVCWVLPARAQGDVDALGRRIRQHESFQVRVQAALALGASRSDKAVKSLCGALDDEAASVRAAAAAALRRLSVNSGMSCLQDRARRETNVAAKAQMQRAIEQIARTHGGESGAFASRPPNKSSHVYVAVDATLDRTQSNHNVDHWVQSAIRGKLLTASNIAIAPPGQLVSSFARTARLHGLRALLLRPSIEKVSYEGTKLTVVLRLTLFTCPDMALQGEFAPKLTMTMPSTIPNNREAEEELIRLAAKRAVESFVATSI
ncbi:MAG: HEAT repeat domain-containing protein [Polyangiaceae bacterium]|jgi:hypothetical protein|nr:HEAT repeat domain-containing protein [Polyangiaceae bacterium]